MWDLDGLLVDIDSKKMENHLYFAKMSMSAFNSFFDNIFDLFKKTEKYTRVSMFNPEYYEFTLTEEFYEKTGIYAFRYYTNLQMNIKYYCYGNTKMINNFYYEGLYRCKFIVTELSDCKVNWEEISAYNIRFDEDIKRSLLSNPKYFDSECNNNIKTFITYLKYYKLDDPYYSSYDMDFTVKLNLILKIDNYIEYLTLLSNKFKNVYIVLDVGDIKLMDNVLPELRSVLSECLNINTNIKFKLSKGALLLKEIINMAIN